MARITIVGSGPSGIHFALSLLKKGHRVELIDVGYSGHPPVNPGDSFNELKNNLEDPVRYFLGDNFETVVATDSSSVYEFPPNKQFIFKKPEGTETILNGFEPHLSYARGGLAEAWTGGSYAFNDHDLEDFPFSYSDIEPFYNEIAERIGLIGLDDDLSRFFPYHKNLIPPLELDEHSSRLFEKYQLKKGVLNSKLGMYLGRSRIATLSVDKGNRKKCDYSGRCQWGCPSDSLYVPSLTLEECLGYETFNYIPDILVTGFDYDKNKVTSVYGRNIKTGSDFRLETDTLALAAGTISSSRIFLESIYNKEGKILKLEGLMDNRQILAPFIHLGMIGRQYDPDTYQYHQLAVGLEMPEPREYVHGQITTLKTGLLQPPFQSMPLDFKTSIYLGRHLHAAFGVVNINLCDTRRKSNFLTLSEVKGGRPQLVINYEPPEDEMKKIKFSVKKMKKFFGKLGAFMPGFQVQLRPMGASVHYSGTIPMSDEPLPGTVTSNCRSNDFGNLYIVDGSTFPFLPAKNLTFTLMANAVRIAEREF